MIDNVEPASERPTRKIKVEIPIRDPDGGYNPARIDCRLTPRQALALRHIYEGLDAVRVDRNRRISNPNDVIRFILDRVGDELEL